MEEEEAARTGGRPNVANGFLERRRPSHKGWHVNIFVNNLRKCMRRKSDRVGLKWAYIMQSESRNASEHIDMRD